MAAVWAVRETAGPAGGLAPPAPQSRQARAALLAEP